MVAFHGSGGRNPAMGDYRVSEEVDADDTGLYRFNMQYDDVPEFKGTTSSCEVPADGNGLSRYRAAYISLNTFMNSAGGISTRVHSIIVLRAV